MSAVIKSNGRGSQNFAGQCHKKADGVTAAVSSLNARENEVTFQTPDGVEMTGRVSRLARHALAFEIGNPAAALRTSEVLANFKIVAANRVIYFGRATVSNVVNAGGSLVCEAKLDDLGSETAFFLPSGQSPPNIEAAYQAFFQAWQNHYRISNEFKVLVADVESYLVGVRQWLEQLEFGLKEDAAKAAKEREILEAVAPKVIASFNGRHERFEELVYAQPPESRGAHQDFVRRHWHKLFLGSPFGHRTFYKPIGYAGDYEMMNMIHRNQPEGSALFDKLIHLLLVSQWPARSVRNRIDHLGEYLLAETARVARGGRTARVLNIGCGPAREVQEFLKRSPLSNQADFTLIDFNQETLLHAGGKLADAKREFLRRTPVQTRHLSVYELLKRARDGKGGEKFDFIYCAGLFDYLAPDTCRALTDLWQKSLFPGGLLLFANMNDTKPFRNFIEFVLDWQLIYRDSREILSLVPEGWRDSARVVAEPTSVNLFVHYRKPD